MQSGFSMFGQKPSFPFVGQDGQKPSFGQGDNQDSMPFIPMSHGPHFGPSMGMPMFSHQQMDGPSMMASYGRPPMPPMFGMGGPPPMFGMGGPPPMFGMGGPPVFGMGSGPQQPGPSPLMGGIMQAIMRAKLMSANSADSTSDNYDYDYSATQTMPAPPSPMLMPIIQSMMAARAQSQTAGAPAPMLMPAIMQSMMAARAQSQLSQPNLEIAFKAPAIVPANPDVPVEINPTTPSKQQSGPDNDQVSFRSGP